MFTVEIPRQDGYRIIWVKRITAWPAFGNPRIEKLYPIPSDDDRVLVNVESHTVLCWNTGLAPACSVQPGMPFGGYCYGAVLANGDIVSISTRREARTLFREWSRTPGAEPMAAGGKVVEIPAPVMEHVQQLTAANNDMLQEILRLRTALVHEGHAHDCQMVTGAERAACSCSRAIMAMARQSADIITPEQMAERYPKMLARIEAMSTTEQQLRELFRVPRDLPLVRYCAGLVQDIRRMNEALRQALEASGEEVDGGERN